MAIKISSRHESFMIYSVDSLRNVGHRFIYGKRLYLCQRIESPLQVRVLNGHSLHKELTSRRLAAARTEL